MARLDTLLARAQEQIAATTATNLSALEFVDHARRAGELAGLNGVALNELDMLARVRRLATPDVCAGDVPVQAYVAYTVAYMRGRAARDEA